MKKNVIKTAIAAICVVAAGMGGMKAYNANLSETDNLLAENVEALSAGDYMPSYCCAPGNDDCYCNGMWTPGRLFW